MKKICIIKLGAKGDVVRTLSLLPKIKDVFPESEITWVTKDNTKELFYNNLYVYKVLGSNDEIKDNFDVLFSLDMDKEASDIAMKINAVEKKGFYLDGEYPVAFNLGAEYYVNTFFDDELKKNNRKTVQEMYFMASDFDYSNDFCPIFLTDEEKAYGKKFLDERGIAGKKIIGIHIGSSPRWPSKTWHLENLKDFIKKIKRQNYEVLLFGGPIETEIMPKILLELKNEGIIVYGNDPSNTDREFFSLVNSCDIMIVPDSFSLHVSLALKKPTIALFFCTSPNEIEGYNLLKKVTSPKLYDFFPQKMNEYSEELVKSISSEEVLGAVSEIENKNVKLKSFEELSEIVTNLKKENKKIIWTSGCFDILHHGHTRYLKMAKAYGDCLIVGLNSDSSVKLLKGQNRPINNENTRAEVLSSLSSVDYIILFSDTSPTKYLAEFKPDFYLKGGDYTIDGINQIERKLVENYGGKIIIEKLEKGVSTTKIIEKIKNIYKDTNK